MKITNTFETSSQIQSTQGSSQEQVALSAAHEPLLSPAKTGDSAHLSVLSTQVSQAASPQTSDVRMDKVAAIQSALAAGTYSVHPSQVASKLVDSMLNSSF